MIDASSFGNSKLAPELSQLSDISLSDKEVFSLIDKITTSGDFGIGEQTALTKIMQDRSQKIALTTNVFRMMYESAMSVIRNLRS